MVGLYGCLIQNLSPETRMRDSVIELNEGARWGRMDVASGHVSPLFRTQFKLSHMRWGRDIQIADWAYSPSYAKPLSVPQGRITLLTRFGMNVADIPFFCATFLTMYL